MRDEIYASIGLEKRPRGWHFNGEPCQFDYDAHSPYAAAILARPEYRELIAAPTRELAALGFEIFWKLTCSPTAITIWYTSTFTNTIGYVSICDRYVCCLVQNNHWLKWCDRAANMRQKHPLHMKALKKAQAARARTIAVISALLPQPIAEEIALYVSLDVSFHET